MKNYTLILLTFFSIIFSSCKDNNNPITPGESFAAPTIFAGEVYVSGTKVSVYSYDSLKVGYRKLYFKVTDSLTGAVLTNAPVSFIPMMQMTSMAHTTPYWQSDSVPSNNFYTGSMVYIMPGNSMEYWYLMMTVDNKVKSRKETQNLRINVGSSSEAYVLTGSDSVKYVLCLHKMNKAAVGINDITFSVHKRASMMSFPEVNDITLDMTPDMPSMGHGSPNNVNPSYYGMGLYKGKVNFTMTGEWRLTVKMKRGSAELLTKEFFITL